MPFDSILSDSLLVGDDYQFNESDVVNEIEDGYIIKQGDTYLVYLKDKSKAKNIRTQDEIVLQSYGVHPKDAHNIVELKKEYKLDKDSIITYELDRTQEEVSAETKHSEHTVLYITEKEYVTLNGIDLYVFNQEIPDDAVFIETLLTPASYKLKQSDVVKDIKEGAIVRLDGKLMVYLNNRNDTKRIRSLKDLEKEIKKSIEEFKESGEKRDSNKVPAGAIGGSGTRDASGRYVTDDGYVFSPYDVIRDLGNGFIVPHEDHFHFIPKSDLTASELAIAYKVLGSGGGNGANSNHRNNAGAIIHEHSGGKTADGRYMTSDGYIYSVGTIVSVDDFGVVASHGDHFHYIPFNDLSDKERQETQAYIKQHFGIDKDLVGNSNSSTSGTNSIEVPTTPTIPSTNTNQTHSNNQKPSPQPSPNASKPNQDNQNPTPQPSEDVNETNLNNEKPAPQPSENKQENKDEVQKIKDQFAKKLEELNKLPIEQRHREGDGLVFDPSTITRSIVMNGEVSYVVPHEDHYHVIRKSQLSKLEQELAEYYANSSEVIENKLKEEHKKAEAEKAKKQEEERKKAEAEKAKKQEEERKKAEAEKAKKQEEERKKAEAEKAKKQEEERKKAEAEKAKQEEEERKKAEAEKAKQEEEERKKNEKEQAKQNKKIDLVNRHIEKLPKGKDGKPYTTSDGYVFSADSIISYDDEGILASHEDHTHYIPYAELEDYELKAAEDFINKKENNVSEVPESKYSSDEIKKKVTIMAIINGIDPSEVKVTGNEMIVPHGNHSHTFNLDTAKSALRKSDYEDEEDYRSEILGMKMRYFGLQHGDYSNVRRIGDNVIYERVGEPNIEVKLNDIKLPIDYDEVDFSYFATEDKSNNDSILGPKVDNLEANLQYIADQYKVPRSHVRRFIGNLVTIDGHGAVDLSLVDINDPVIYSLKNDDEKNKKSTEESNTTNESNDSENNESPSTEDLIEFIAQYYNVDKNKVEKFTKNDFVVKGEEANTMIKKSDVIAKLKGEPVDLPKLNTSFDEEDEDKQPEEESNENTPQAPSNEELINAIANHYGIGRDRVTYFSGMFLILSGSEEVENVRITKEQAISLLRGEAVTLPPLPKAPTSNRQAAEDSEESVEESTEESEVSSEEADEPTSENSQETVINEAQEVPAVVGVE